MTFCKHGRCILLTGAMGFIAGCGDTASHGGFSDPSVTSGPSSVSILELNATDGTVTTTNGTLDGDGNRIAAGVLKGSIDAPLTTVSGPDGLRVSIHEGSTDYVRFFDAESVDGELVRGVIGFPTPSGSPPRHLSTWTGSSEVRVHAEKEVIFDLKGDVRVIADLDSLTFDTDLINLEGQHFKSDGTEEYVTDVGTLSIDGYYHGSHEPGDLKARMDSDVIFTAGELSPYADVKMSMMQYGPGGEEMGGAILIDNYIYPNSKVFALRISGRFVATEQPSVPGGTAPVP
ncbi:hypothetical protein [Oceaniglobus trochenteri]|uniref:hypothetical protein n=1 Tax=Oceaniglobus trochenteri TaxID=2763260 RepID=UPI001CFFA766|nr:hypothetical protein [Oceaniglobus trochenteri]